MLYRLSIAVIVARQTVSVSHWRVIYTSWYRSRCISLVCLYLYQDTKEYYLFQMKAKCSRARRKRWSLVSSRKKSDTTNEKDVRTSDMSMDIVYLACLQSFWRQREGLGGSSVHAFRVFWIVSHILFSLLSSLTVNNLASRHLSIYPPDCTHSHIILTKNLSRSISWDEGSIFTKILRIVSTSQDPISNKDWRKLMDEEALE